MPHGRHLHPDEPPEPGRAPTTDQRPTERAARPSPGVLKEVVVPSEALDENIAPREG